MLKKDKNVLMLELVRLQHEQQNTDHELQVLDWILCTKTPFGQLLSPFFLALGILDKSRMEL
jgi:hypothetical protein